jgi:hypothetical protein
MLKRKSSQACWKNKEKKRKKEKKKNDSHVLKIKFKGREIIQEGVIYFHIIHFHTHAHIDQMVWLVFFLDPVFWLSNIMWYKYALYLQPYLELHI